MFKYDEEKSRSYEYGKGKEFPTREAAQKHAEYKKKAMIAELGVRTMTAAPEIRDDGATLQVVIPVKYEVY